MKTRKSRIPKRSSVASRFVNEQISRQLGLLIIGLTMSVLITACGRASASPGTVAGSINEEIESVSLGDVHEFGLTMEQLAAKIESIEGHIAACMSAAGFDYVAVDFNTVRSGMQADKSISGVSEEEYIKTYGFGISTLFTGIAPQHSEATTPAKIGLGEQNVRIYSELAPAAQVAYNHTLFGEHSNATLAVMLEAEDFSRAGGCTLAAVEQVFTPEQLAVSYVNPKDILLEQDPRMVAALGQFGSCMRDAGFNFTHPNDAEIAIQHRLDSILDGGTLETISAAGQTELTKLQGEERAIAAANAECEAAFIHPVEEEIEDEG